MATGAARLISGSPTLHTRSALETPNDRMTERSTVGQIRVHQRAYVVRSMTGARVARLKSSFSRVRRKWPGHVAPANPETELA